MGGTLAAIESGFIQNEIQNAAYAYQQAVERGEAVVVGVNKFQQPEKETPRCVPPRSGAGEAAGGAPARTAGVAQRGFGRGAPVQLLRRPPAPATI